MHRFRRKYRRYQSEQGQTNKYAILGIPLVSNDDIIHEFGYYHVPIIHHARGKLVFVHRSRVALRTETEGGEGRKKRNMVETKARYVKRVESCRRQRNTGGRVRGTEEIAAWNSIGSAFAQLTAGRWHHIQTWSPCFKVIIRYVLHWKRVQIEIAILAKVTSLKNFLRKFSDADRQRPFRARGDKHNGRLWNRVKGCQTSFQLRAWRIDGRIVRRDSHARSKKKSGWDHPRTWPTSIIIALHIRFAPFESIAGDCNVHTTHAAQYSVDSY